MLRKALYGEDAKADSPINFIFQNAQAIPLALEAAPTSSGGQLPSNGDAGYFGTNLYINLGGTTYRLSMTAV